MKSTIREVAGEPPGEVENHAVFLLHGANAVSVQPSVSVSPDGG